jgi:tight adherence protein B
MTLLIALLGVAAGLGIVLFIVAIRGTELPQVQRRRPGALSAEVRIEHLAVRLAVGGIGGLLVGLITQWPVAGLFAAGLGFVIPGLIGSGDQRKGKISRIEAIAAWAEMLRDTMAGAGGLEQSIIACSGVAPLPIRREVLRLAARLERDRLAPSLREFAEEIDDPTGDLVVAALVLAADKSPKKLGSLLGMLAQSARAEVNMRLRVEAGRARTRTAVRVISGVTAAFTAFLVFLNRRYLDPYDSFTGQLVLVVVGACFTAAFYWLVKAAQFEGEDRFLTTEELV